MRHSNTRVGAHAALGLAALCAGCGQVSAPVPHAESAEAKIERGRYLVTALDCNACHTPHDETGQPIAGRELTGHPAGAVLPQWDPSMLEKGVLVTMNPTLTAFAGPFGTVVAPNLTPDPETGIGGMTAEALIKSWREGVHWQTGAPIRPPMPWQSYGHLTDDDIRAVHAYLMSLTPKKAEPLPG